MDNKSCYKEGHDEEPFTTLCFSEQEQNILKCLNCLNEVHNDFQISINQLLKKPSSEISNWPPLKDKELQKKIKELMKTQKEEQQNRNTQQQELKEQIEQIFQKQIHEIVQQLDLVKNNIFQQIDLYFYYDFNQIFDLQEIKNSLQDYFSQKIQKKELFQKMKNFMQNLPQENKTDFIYKQQSNETQALKNNYNYIQDKISSIKNWIQPLDLQLNNDIDFLQFEPSTYNNQQKEISITSNKIDIIFSENETGKRKNVFSNILNNEKTYKLRFKINLQQKQFNNVQIVFGVVNNVDKNQSISWSRCGFQYQIGSAFSCKRNTKTEIVNGIKQIFENKNEIIVNFIFNIKKKIYQLYDDEKNFYMENIEQQVQQDNNINEWVFAIGIYQGPNCKNIVKITQ
ncbi:hypothetical protein PPERSA_10222 [Pseudocohnilembus persalinus]|uniref:Uncharacterized protein n=1 Tax=Pseudocohnilembus persalinus TaxID=266149 RepID=A0A0V0QMF2_PSEPJ|nr:hypothetical protein PPERSA_10222 [Pseudocohnilembus persalinus]|eukprot:KRX03141.1 hypothetical protein PPERSA_10222 [Pseudocohnilembus persalinus]